MVYFYSLYSPVIENPPLRVEDSKKVSVTNRLQLADDFNKDILFRIPWVHHEIIINKCNGNVKKANLLRAKTSHTSLCHTTLCDTNLCDSFFIRIFASSTH